MKKHKHLEELFKKDKEKEKLFKKDKENKLDINTFSLLLFLISLVVLIIFLSYIKYSYDTKFIQLQSDLVNYFDWLNKTKITKEDVTMLTKTIKDEKILEKLNKILELMEKLNITEVTKHEIIETGGSYTYNYYYTY